MEFIAAAYQNWDLYRPLAEEKYYCARAELFDLSEKKTIVRNLSRNEAKGINAAGFEILSPKVLLVDEPMVGLDPASIERGIKTAG